MTPISCGRREGGQAPIGLRQADGKSFLSLDAGAHQAPRRRLAVEFKGNGRVADRPGSAHARRPGNRLLLPIGKRASEQAGEGISVISHASARPGVR